MARAIMEGAAFELRWALEAVQGAGLPVERLWMVGGAANSSLWSEILASVTDVPIRVPGYDNWPALGAAILAGMGVGLVGSIEDGLSHFRRMSRAVEPNQELRTQYDDGYAIYKEYAEQNRH
jgi:xylulokinase